MKKQFEEYILEITGKTVENNGFSATLEDKLRKAYNLGAGLKKVLSDRKNDAMANDLINTAVRESHKIQIHNIGKDPYQRYYAHEKNKMLHFPWLVLEQYLIKLLYSIEKDFTFIQNRTIAERIGWLAESETDPERIRAAIRKVADNLQVLKETRNTFTVVQKHNPGKSGSYHIIKANWLVIIPLYNLYMDDIRDLPIRERKGIRFRMITLLGIWIKSFTEGLKKLLMVQRTKYLFGLVTMNQDAFRCDREILGNVISKDPCINEILHDLTQCIPDIDLSDDGVSILTVKTSRALTLLVNPEPGFDVRRAFQKVYHKKLIIEQAF